MSRRYTVNSSDYPEHLNPFREEKEDTDFIKNKFNTVGRRKSRAVLNVTSWAMFQTKNSKPDDKEVTSLPKSNRNKFMTLTPKISRHLMDMLSPKTSPSKKPSPTKPATNPVLTRETFHSASEFTIMPRSSRERFAVTPQNKERPKDEGTASNGMDDSPPAPDVISAPKSSSNEEQTPTTPLSKVHRRNDFPEEESKYTRQGAKPKKKRQAPLPPSLPSTAAGHKHANVAATGQSLAISVIPEGSKLSTQSNSDTPSTREESWASSATPEGSELSIQSNSETPSTQEESLASSVVQEGSELSTQSNSDTPSTQAQYLASSVVQEGSELSTQSNSDTPSTQEQSLASSVIPEGSELSTQSNSDTPSTQEQSLASSVIPEGSELSTQSNSDTPSTQEQSLASSVIPEGSELSTQSTATRLQPQNSRNIVTQANCPLENRYERKPDKLSINEVV